MESRPRAGAAVRPAPRIAHRTPQGRPAAARESAAADQVALGLYLHIPFCGAICHYCNFNRGLLDAGLKARYVEALDAEIRGAADGSVADTIYFGGGTPSLLA